MSLNHPHIGAIYRLDDANSMQFLVLELVEGESLDKRISIVGYRQIGKPQRIRELRFPYTSS